MTLYIRAEKWTRRKEPTNPLTGETWTKRKQRWIPVGTVCTACRFPVIQDARVPKRRRPDDITTVEKSLRWVGERGGKKRDIRYNYEGQRRAMEHFYGGWNQEDYERQAEKSREHWKLYSEAMDRYFEMAGLPY